FRSSQRMDRASAIRIIHSGRCPYLGDGRTNQPWPNRFLHRSTLLAKNLGLIEKGRMIEIEAIYCSLFAFALILWLLLWEQKRSPWLPSSCPGSFLVRPAGERSKSRPVLLSYRWRRSLAKSSPPRPNSPGALHRTRGHARNSLTG